MHEKRTGKSGDGSPEDFSDAAKHHEGEDNSGAYDGCDICDVFRAGYIYGNITRKGDYFISASCPVDFLGLDSALKEPVPEE